MISLICETCKDTLATGAGRWVADNGNVTFYCAACEQKLLVAAVKTVKPKIARKVVRPSNGASIEQSTKN